MISISNISLTFGSQEVFDNISCSLGSQRVGLVGRNGAGKSTFLKAIAGQLKLDSGSISIERGQKVAYMPQEVILESDRSVFDEAFDVFGEFVAAEQERTAVEDRLATAPDDAEQLLDRYEELNEKLAQFDKNAAGIKTKQILLGLGFNEAQLASPVQTLSVGWKMRIVLAKLLLQDADYYLFDEPTNHLDLIAKEWFSNFLARAQFGFLLVTHDRYFLDFACNAIFELERGKGTWYAGNFTKYVELKEERQAVTQSAYDRQQKEIARKKATIDRFRASASKASTAQSMIKQLEKMELVEVEPPLPTIKLTFPPVARSGQIVMTVKNAHKSFDGRTIFKNASCEVTRGEKVAIVAANGVGKTTFFNLVAAAYPDESEFVSFGHNVELAIFEQDQAKVLDPKKTVYAEVSDAIPAASESTIRAFLGSFLFSGDDIKKRCGVLSGGERNRVAMVKVLLHKANFLLLDEPTNHLDLYAKDILLQALQKYEGTMLFVSHDHDFIQKLATRIIELTPDGMHSYLGDYESYLWCKKEQEARLALEAAPQASAEAPTGKSKQNKNNGAKSEEPKQPNASQQRELKKELHTLEQQIQKLEKQLEKASNEFIGLGYGTPRYKQLSETMDGWHKELAQSTERWEQIQKILATLA